MAALENNVPSFKLPKYEIQAQVVLYLLSFSGFLISFTTRTDINIAIVAIVKLQNPSPTKTLLRILLWFAMITPSTLPLFKTTVLLPDVWRDVVNAQVTLLLSSRNLPGLLLLTPIPIQISNIDKSNQHNKFDLEQIAPLFSEKHNRSSFPRINKETSVDIEPVAT
ncbi:hypothetical protein J6590_062986 [Homalodisca vitripennis]|nr:hypothetical protein J6590_062986 [Homalodisca vitripennis]